MMADLMDENVGDNGAQRVAMLGPVIENGPAVEEHYIGKPSGLLEGLVVREADALEQSQEIELALGLHFVQHLVGRKVLDTNEEPAAEGAKALRKSVEGMSGEGLDLGECWRFEID